MSTLTQHPSGSIRESLRLSLPLMASYLSSSFMQFIDRILVGRLDIDNVNGIIISTTIAMFISYSASGITSISTIFSGREYGAKEYKKVMIPIWQMVYFSLMLSLLTIPLGLFGYKYANISSEVDGEIYFKWIVGSAFLIPLTNTLHSFFNSIGKTYIITITAVTANILNLLLDLILIFGYSPLSIPSLGMKGAAIATVIASFSQILFLLYILTKKKYREKFNTLKPVLRLKVLVKCIKIGAPRALCNLSEVTAWYYTVVILSNISTIHRNVFSITLNLFLYSQFVYSGIYGGLVTIISYQIGAKKFNLVKKAIKSNLLLCIISTTILILPLIISPSLAVTLLTGGNKHIDADLYENSIKSLNLIYPYVFILYAKNVFAGILTAGGDTKFLMWTDTILVWFLSLLPILLFSRFTSFPPYFNMSFFYPYVVVSFMVQILRYKSGKWLHVT